MRLLTLISSFVLTIETVQCLRVLVAGYNSKLATYDVVDNTLSPAVEWDVGDQVNTRF